jgi:hypothetical protein
MPAMRASLAERFIFNFRLPAKAVPDFVFSMYAGITVAALTTQIGLTRGMVPQR